MELFLQRKFSYTHDADFFKHKKLHKHFVFRKVTEHKQTYIAKYLFSHRD